MQKPMVVPIPERGREMKTSRIPQISLDTMRLQLLGTMKKHKSEPIINNLEIIDKNIKFTEISKNQPKDLYHQACKNHALFLIPDTTLEDMKTIVNFKVSKKKETRYRDPKVEELSQYDYFMHKLDTVIEKLDDLDSTSESSCASHLSDKDIEEYMAKPFTKTPFNFLIYKLNNIVRKLDEITKPLPDGSIEKLYQDEMFLNEPSEISTNNRDTSINKSVTFMVENRNIGKEDHVTPPLNPFTQSLNLEEHKLYYCETKTDLSQIPPVNQSHINTNIELTKPLLLPSTLHSKSLNFTVAGHFNDCKPIFQVHKCDFDNINHELYKLHRKKNTNINNTYTQKSKKLHISIAGKLLKKQNISQWRHYLGKQTNNITVIPELQEQVAKVFSFRSSISNCDLNQLHVSISGEYTKDEDKDQYFPAVSIQIKQNKKILRRSQKIQSVNSKFIDFANARELKNFRRGNLLKGSRPVKNRKSIRKLQKQIVNNISESDEEINPDKNIQPGDYELNRKEEENESLVNIILFNNEEQLEEEEIESKSEKSIPYYDLPIKSEEKLLLKNTTFNYENPQSYDLEGNIIDEKNQTTVENKVKYQEQPSTIFKTHDIAVYNVKSDMQTNIFKDAQISHDSPNMIITTKDEFASHSKIIKKVSIIKKGVSYVGDCIRNKLKYIKTRTMSLLSKKGAKSNSDTQKEEEEKPNVPVKRKKQKGPNICENPILGQFEEFFID